MSISQSHLSLWPYLKILQTISYHLRPCPPLWLCGQQVIRVGHHLNYCQPSSLKLWKVLRLRYNRRHLCRRFGKQNAVFLPELMKLKGCLDLGQTREMRLSRLCFYPELLWLVLREDCLRVREYWRILPVLMLRFYLCLIERSSCITFKALPRWLIFVWLGYIVW